jgi:hypothetical protein
VRARRCGLLGGAVVERAHHGDRARDERRVLVSKGGLTARWGLRAEEFLDRKHREEPP